MTLNDVATLLFRAVETLAVGDAPQRERLWRAYIESVSKVGLHQDKLPQEERELFDSIRAEMTWVEPTGEEGSVTATALQMTDAEARRVIDRIIALLQRVTWALADEWRDQGRQGQRFPYHPSPN
jgi:hypothetical protein